MPIKREIADRKSVTVVKGLDMYFNKDIAKSFAEREQNEKNFRVAQIIDRVILGEIQDLKDPLYVAELGGGAHPDRYDGLFARLVNTGGHIDWVDISPHMLELADQYLNNEKYRERKKVISYITAEITDYLGGLPDEKLDLAIMKYTIDHIADLDVLFGRLARKLKSSGRMVSLIGLLEPRLKSVSTNARFLYNGEEFPYDEVRTLKDGDTFTVKFLKEPGNLSAGYLAGAETVKYYHSPERMNLLAQKYGFEVFLGDWKSLVKEGGRGDENMAQDILILRKK